MSQYVLDINAVGLNMTGFVLKKNGLVLKQSDIVINMTGFDFFLNHMGPAQPSLLV